MRIALITRSATDDGGVSVHVRRSAWALRSAGHDVVMISSASFASLAAGRLDEADIPRLVEQLREHDADAVHFHYVDQASLVRAAGGVAPTAVSAHGWSGCSPNTRYFRGECECPRAYGPGCLVSMLVRNCKHTKNPVSAFGFYREGGERIGALRAADVAIAHSSAVEAHLHNNSVHDVHRVVLPIDVPAEDPRPPSGPALVAYVGRLVSAKGVDVLIRSVAYFDAHVEIAGDGWVRDRLERLAAELGLGDRVIFRGWLSPEAVDDLYERAHVVAVPSRWPEPFGMSGPEALARGRPVVASRTGGTSDWLDDGVTGIAVDPERSDQLGAAIARLLADTARSSAMGQRGRELVAERFTERRHVADVIAAYEAARTAAAMKR